MKECKKSVSDAIKNLAKRSAIHYANVACPVITYQPKAGQEVKRLRKF